jgi:hypothetical protein
MGTGGPPPLLPPEKLYSFLIRSCAELGVPQGLPRFAQSLTNLTSVFGMGTGGSPPPLPPEKLILINFWSVKSLEFKVLSFN